MSTMKNLQIPSDASRLPVTLPRLAEKKRLGEPIVMVTAYDYPSARAAEAAGVDLVLVGDSGAMTVLGYDSTVPVTLDELLVLAAAVRRGLRTPFLVGDLPFGSYEISDEQAVQTAFRFVKEAGCDAVKLEGGGPVSVARAPAIAAGRHPGHGPRRPDAADLHGAGRLQGAGPQRPGRDEGRHARRWRCRTPAASRSSSRRSRARCRAEVMPQMHVPVIGIGAGPATDGQVLVFHDLLGHPRGPRRALRQALRRPAGRDGRRRRGVRGRRAHARLPGARARLLDRRGASSSAFRECVRTLNCKET